MDVARRATSRSPSSRETSSATFRPVAEQKGLDVRGRASTARRAADDRHRRAAAAAGPAEPALERVQVHRRRARALRDRGGARRTTATRTTRSDRADGVVAFVRLRHRHRHPAGQAAPDLRGVPAGRRDDEPHATAAPGSASRSAARSRACSAARSGSRASPGKGSTFTLYLPATYRAAGRNARAPRRAGRARRPARRRRSTPRAREPDGSTARCSLPSEVSDDRDAAQPGDRVVLDRRGRRRRSRAPCSRWRASAASRALVALRGDTGLALAHEYKPDAIVLDLKLPGDRRLALLDRLKRHPATRHIPVHIVSGDDGRQQRAARRRRRVPREAGRRKERSTRRSPSIASVHRPRRQATCSWSRTTRTQRKRDRRARRRRRRRGGRPRSGSSEEALAALESERFDCMVLDLEAARR